MSKIVILFFVVLGFGVDSFSEYHLESGEHRLVETDLLLKNKKQEVFKLSRYYNHKSTAQGLLGAKWCYEFDQSLKLVSAGIELLRCGEPTGIIYTKKKKSYQFGGENVYLKPDDTLIRKTNKNELYVYANDGRLVSVLYAHNKKLKYKLIYSKKTNFLQTIVLKDKTKLILTLNSDGSLKEISVPKNIVLKYDYKQGQLTQVTNQWKQQFGYTYDIKHRITAIMLNGKTIETLNFNKYNMVQSYQKDGCVNELISAFDLKKQNLSYKIKSSCANKNNKEFLFAGSSMFPKNKNKNKIKELSQKRSPASLDPQKISSSQFKIKKNKLNLAEVIETKNYIWTMNYISDTDMMSEVSELNKKTKQKDVFKIGYDGGEISSITDASNNRIQFVKTQNGAVKKINYFGNRKKLMMTAVRIKNLNLYKEGI